MGPSPRTTFQNSSQSGSDQSHSPLSSFHASLSSGTLIPRSQSLGTYVEKNSCRRLSLVRVLIPQYRSMSFFFEGGPKKCMVGCHHRLTAFWNSSRCCSVPLTSS